MQRGQPGASVKHSEIESGREGSGAATTENRSFEWNEGGSKMVQSNAKPRTEWKVEMPYDEGSITHLCSATIRWDQRLMVCRVKMEDAWSRHP